MLTSFISFGANNASASQISEDWAEENDDFWSARFINPSDYSYLCQGDDDWFNVSIGVDEVIKVSLAFDGDQNDIELELYDSSQMLLDSSYGVDDYESVAWISYIPQYVFIRIYGYDNSEAYNMTVDIVSKGAYDDEYEQNDDFPSASEIYPNYYKNLVNNDSDYYKIYMDSDFSIDIYNTSYLWAQLYSNTESWITDFSIEDSHLKLDWCPTYKGDYYINVSGLDLGDFYDMDIWITDDWAEPNDYFHDATYLDFGHHNNLIQKDNDYYEVWLETDDLLEINLFYDTGYTWMDIELYDDNENLLTNGILDEDHLDLSWTNYDYGRNFSIKVSGPNNQDWYYMELIQNGLMGDDWAEENDYFTEARHLNLGYYDNLIQNDDDWYEVWLEPNDQLKIKLSYDTGYAWMNLELYDENEVDLKNGTNEEDHVFLNWTNDANYGKSFYIKITGDNYGDWYHLDLFVDFKGDDGDDGDDGKNDNDPFANFDLSSIPGFPLEFVGTVFIISTIAIVFFVKKKKL